MANRILFDWTDTPVPLIIGPPHRIIMLLQMVTQMNSGHTSHGRMKTLNHIRVIDLVYNNIDFVAVGQSVHFELVTPDPVFFHVIAVLVDSFIIFNEWDVHVFVRPNVIDGCVSIISVEGFVPIKLVSHRSK